MCSCILLIEVIAGLMLDVAVAGERRWAREERPMVSWARRRAG